MDKEIQQLLSSPNSTNIGLAFSILMGTNIDQIAEAVDYFIRQYFITDYFGEQVLMQKDGLRYFHNVPFHLNGNDYFFAIDDNMYEDISTWRGFECRKKSSKVPILDKKPYYQIQVAFLQNADAEKDYHAVLHSNNPLPPDSTYYIPALRSKKWEDIINYRKSAWQDACRWWAEKIQDLYEAIG